MDIRLDYKVSIANVCQSGIAEPRLRPMLSRSLWRSYDGPMARAGPAALRCGSFLKESRKRAGLSLLEAGQRIGISVGIIKAWENERSIS